MTDPCNLKLLVELPGLPANIGKREGVRIVDLSLSLQFTCAVSFVLFNWSAGE